MGKRKISFQILFLILFVFLTMCSYSQESFTKELRWELNDTIEIPFFQDTSQLIEWGKNLSPVTTRHSKKCNIKNYDVFILIIDKCSGIYCPSIYIFKLENKLWQLITSTHAKLTEQIEIEVDSNLENIIFKTKSNQIGKLPFEMLDLNNDKVE